MEAQCAPCNSFGGGLLSSIRQQRDMARAFDSLCQLALMARARAGHTAGQDLPALRHILSQFPGVFVIDVRNLVHTERAYLAAAAVTLWPL